MPSQSHDAKHHSNLSSPVTSLLEPQVSTSPIGSRSSSRKRSDSPSFQKRSDSSTRRRPQQESFKLFSDYSATPDPNLSILAPYTAATKFNGPEDVENGLLTGQNSHFISPSSSKKSSDSSKKSRKKSLIRPERSRSSARRSQSTRVRRNLISSLDDTGHASPTSMNSNIQGSKKAPLRGCCSRFGVWATLANCVTCCCCDCCLSRCASRKDPLMRQAWREKAALCIIIVFSLNARVITNSF